MMRSRKQLCFKHAPWSGNIPYPWPRCAHAKHIHACAVEPVRRQMLLRHLGTKCFRVSLNSSKDRGVLLAPRQRVLRVISLRTMSSTSCLSSHSKRTTRSHSQRENRSSVSSTVSGRCAHDVGEFTDRDATYVSPPLDQVLCAGMR